MRVGTLWSYEDSVRENLCVGMSNWAPYSQVGRAFEKLPYPLVIFFSLGYWFAFHSCGRSFFKMDMLLFPLIELGFQFVKFLILVVGFHFMSCETYSFRNNIFFREIQLVCRVKIPS